jgi:hypothetical protein
MEPRDYGFLATCPKGHQVNPAYTSAERDVLAAQAEPVRLFCVVCGENWTPPANEQTNIRKWARGETD